MIDQAHVLKPCPFCGGYATIGISLGSDYEPNGKYMICHHEEDVPAGKMCPITESEDDAVFGVGGYEYDTIEELREAWDNREDDKA